MPLNQNRGEVRAFAGFASALLLPSTPIFYRYFGTAGVVAYLVAALCALWLLVNRVRDVLPGLSAKLDDRRFWFLTVATLLVLLALFLVVYPIANSGTLGEGSDSDEALDMATRGLLRGEYPYHQQTYLDNPISQMPGSLFLAAPRR